MERKVRTEKQEMLSFDTMGKETLKDRLYKLMARRSVRAAAEDWGLPFSTLNNYLTKDTEPSLKNIQKIANKEQVTLEWIATGLGPIVAKQTEEGDANREASDFGGLRMVWDSLSEDERSQLLRVLGRKGADALTLLLDEEAFQLLKLTGDARKAALLLEKLPASKLEEILVECSKVQQDPTLNVQHKQAV